MFKITLIRFIRLCQIQSANNSQTPRKTKPTLHTRKSRWQHLLFVYFVVYRNPANQRAAEIWELFSISFVHVEKNLKKPLILSKQFSFGRINSCIDIMATVCQQFKLISLILVWNWFRYPWSWLSMILRFEWPLSFERRRRWQKLITQCSFLCRLPKSQLFSSGCSLSSKKFCPFLYCCAPNHPRGRQERFDFIDTCWSTLKVFNGRCYRNKSLCYQKSSDWYWRWTKAQQKPVFKCQVHSCDLLCSVPASGLIYSAPSSACLHSIWMHYSIEIYDLCDAVAVQKVISKGNQMPIYNTI
jgi:hypothetical protein